MRRENKKNPLNVFISELSIKHHKGTQKNKPNENAGMLKWSEKITKSENNCK